jgi:hypothetical protein
MATPLGSVFMSTSVSSVDALLEETPLAAEDKRVDPDVKVVDQAVLHRCVHERPDTIVAIVDCASRR